MYDIVIVISAMLMLYILDNRKKDPLNRIKDGETKLIEDIEFIKLKLDALDNTNDFILNSLDWSKRKHVQDATQFWRTEIPHKLNSRKIYHCDGKKERADFLTVK